METTDYNKAYVKAYYKQVWEKELVNSEELTETELDELVWDIRRIAGQVVEQTNLFDEI